MTLPATRDQIPIWAPGACKIELLLRSQISVGLGVIVRYLKIDHAVLETEHQDRQQQ